MSRSRLAVVLVGLVALGAPGSARATDGHFLHGVGAVNSAMGGAGVASPMSLLGTLYLNPAGLIAFNQGVRFEFGFEMFKPNRSIASDLPGLASGASVSSTEFVPIPAMAWTAPLAGGRAVVGIGGLAIGGFGVDYGTDMENPILAPRPNGFGEIYSNYGLMKLIPAFAYAPLDNLWVGVAANINWASLAVDPMPIAGPAMDPVTGTAYYSRASDGDGAFGWGFQAGVLYRPIPRIALGVAFTSEQYFDDFQYHAVFENPNLPNFQMPREIVFELDLPMILSGGVAVDLLSNVTVAGDVRYIFYAQTKGFAVEGYDPANPATIFNADGSVKGFGWRNIMVLAGGVQVAPVPQLALRAGYNYSQNPVPAELSMINLPAPAIVQHHITLGVGVRPMPGFEISAAYYRAFERSITGPLMNPAAPAGSTVTNSMHEDSFLVQFSFAPAGLR